MSDGRLTDAAQDIAREDERRFGRKSFPPHHVIKETSITGRQLATIAFTKEQLWTLLNIFQAGFESGLPENALEDLVSAKLDRAYKSFTGDKK